MASNTPQINYFSRDFETLRNSLVNYARTYFPNTYNDFSPSSTGMMFINMAAYVGDILSFYLDNQVQETFIQYAKQEENIYALAYLLGYKPKVATPAVTTVDFYQQLPAIASGSIQVPNYSYALTVPQGTVISTAFGVPANFNTLNKVDFSFSSSLDPTEITVYTVSNGIPTYFLAKKSVQAVEGTVKNKSFSFGGAQEFPTVLITDSNIVNIQSCTDTAGNVWYEVDNLAQDLIYDTKANTSTNDPNNPPTDTSDTPNLLQLKKVERRFATRFINNTTLEIQFGNGGTANTTEEIIPNPDNVGLGLTIGQSKLTTAFSPTNFIFSNTYGISPSNTILTFQYLTSNGTSGNVSVNSLTQFSKASLTFKTVGLDSSVSNLVVNSVTATNPSAASGGGDGDTLNEVKQNALGNFQSQLRAVTPEDYIIRAYSLPAELGTISKAFVTSEKLATLQQGETPSILNLYILSKDRSGNFTIANDSLKKNLKTYLSQYRSISDTIKIKDAFIINIGINFDIVVRPNSVGDTVLASCINSLNKIFFNDNWQINQPILLGDLYSTLDAVEGVQTVKNIQIVNLTSSDGNYSQYAYDTQGATINRIVYPSVDPMIFEVKFPNTDIKGRIVPY
jgi:hypothetical protein